MPDLIYRIAKQSDADPFEYVMSEESVDRMGDVIQADGWDLADFKRNPIGLFNHHADAIIGRWENVRVLGRQLRARFVFAEEGTSQIADTARKLWNQKILRGASVGFQAVKREPLHKDADPHFGPFRYLKQQLLECSLVSVPANPNALPVMRSYHLLPEISRQIFGKPASQDRAVSRVPAKPPASSGGKPMSTLAKRIEAAQFDLNAFRDQLTELSKKDDPADDEIALIDELQDNQIPAAEQNLARLERMEKTLGTHAVERQDGDSQQVAVSASRPFALPKKKVEPADYMFRAVAAGVRAFGRQEPLEHSLREMYGADEATQIVLRAAVNPARTDIAGWAAELVQTVNMGFLDRLIGASLYGPLAAAGSRYDLGRNGSIKIPARANTPKAAGAWVGEGAPKPVKRIGLSTVSLIPHKLAVITTFTEEIAMSSVPAIEGLLRKAMADDTSEALDGYLIDNVAASATRPAGLLNGVTPLTPASSGTTLEKIVTDLNALITPMEAAGGGGNVVLLMNPAQARRIGMSQTSTGDFAFGSAEQAASKIGATRIVSSITVPTGTVIAVDADWFATATGDSPRFAVSNEATLHEEDTTPVALGTPGSPNVVAAPMRSLFQTDSVAIRLSLFVTWAMVRPGMVQVVPGVGW
jgi:HK97 family phage major capsid protein/HK97 family phage prohead protease